MVCFTVILRTEAIGGWKSKGRDMAIDAQAQ